LLQRQSFLANVKNHLLAVARVVQLVSPRGETVPTNEKQLRPLVPLLSSPDAKDKIPDISSRN
jgi:hypothetical protein